MENIFIFSSLSHSFSLHLSHSLSLSLSTTPLFRPSLSHSPSPFPFSLPLASSPPPPPPPPPRPNGPFAFGARNANAPAHACATYGCDRCAAGCADRPKNSRRSRTEPPWIGCQPGSFEGDRENAVAADASVRLRGFSVSYPSPVDRPMPRRRSVGVALATTILRPGRTNTSPDRFHDTRSSAHFRTFARATV